MPAAPVPRRLRVVVDNTVATPWGLRVPLLSVPGIDLVVASGTKALAGADRDMWGYLAGNQLDLLNEAMDLQAMRGGILDWRRAGAILSGLEAARARFIRRCETATAVARFLAAHPRVEQVFHPSLPDHADAAVVAEHYRLPGSMISFRVRDADEAATRHVCDVLAMTGVPRYALSFDGLATKINHHRSVSEYFTAEGEVLRIGVDRLIRLGIGVEAADDLISLPELGAVARPAGLARGGDGVAAATAGRTEPVARDGLAAGGELRLHSSAASRCDAEFHHGLRGMAGARRRLPEQVTEARR